MKRDGIKYQPAKQHIVNGTRASIDAYAQQCADAAKLSPGADLQPVIKMLGGRLHYIDPLAAERIQSDESDNTILVHGPKDFDILVSIYSTPGRARFTIAHELGHYLLHSKFGKIPISANRGGSDRAEWEANWFAAGLLMPRREFSDDAERLDVAALARRYVVSPEAVEIRCKALGIQCKAHKVR